ncbi:ABC transporter ATP-binding protein [Leifsonia sp. NPDC056824]|uniref:ABC transporter ATP-binding protein n=1 Tax=Leifsonia sp. NPDC056824 TaxID=3345953 RepID=UPI00369188FF
MSQRNPRLAKSNQKARLRDFIPYSAGTRGTLIAGAVFSLLATGAQIVQPLFVQQVVTSIPSGGPVAALVAALLLITVGEAIFSGLQTLFLQGSAERFVKTVRRGLVRKLLILSIREYDVRQRADLIARVTSDSTMLRSVVTSGLLELFSAGIMFIAASAFMLSIDTTLYGAVALSVTLGTVASVLISKRLRIANRDVQSGIGGLASEIDRAIGGVRTVRASGATAQELASLNDRIESVYQRGLRTVRLNALIRPALSLFIQGCFLIVVTVGGLRVASGQLEIGELVTFILYLFLFLQPVAQVLGTVAELQLAMAALDRVAEIERLPEEDESSDGDVAVIHDGRGSRFLEFDRVGFGYTAESRVLERVSFSVERGTQNAIVGLSGAGKSTLMGLIERFYEVDDGRIALDGVDVRALPRDQLRARIGYIEQDAPALAGSVADNLRIGKPDATRAQMLAALASVRLDEFISNAPDGLDTLVGEQGVMLSGGQRQRLAWARVLLADPEVLLLDEPTSSLDSVTEEALQELLRSGKGQRTVLIIAHRLATVADSDQIVLLHDGRTENKGTHTELLKSSHVYRNLAERQLIAPLKGDESSP